MKARVVLKNQVRWIIRIDLRGSEGTAISEDLFQLAPILNPHPL